MTLLAVSARLALVFLALAVACGDDEGPQSSLNADFPAVVDVVVEPLADGAFDVAVTVSSPYDSPERYADAWRVTDPDGTVLGVRELAHDHAAEQPFTRSLVVAIPDGVDEVTVEARDLVNGYGGDTLTVSVPSRTPGA